MLAGTLLSPTVLIAAMVEGAMMSLGSARWISIDDQTTRQHHAAGFLRLDARGSVDRRG